MQTKEQETAAVDASGFGDPVRRPRARRLTAVLVGLAAIATAAVGVVAAGDDAKDAPSNPATTQLIPFVTTEAPGSGGGGVDG